MTTKIYPLTTKAQNDVTIYAYRAPSGVEVYSCKSPVPPRWWDEFPRHLVWSYASWISWILLEFGHPRMRHYLRGRGWWKK